MPLVQLEITRQERFASGMEFGDVGTYELLHGIAHYEVDPKHPANSGIIDLELASDVASGAATDQLEDALDYAAISQRVIAEVEASSYQLIETLAEHLAQLIRTDFAVPWLRLVVTKPTAVPEADAVGVVIERGSRP